MRTGEAPPMPSKENCSLPALAVALGVDQPLLHAVIAGRVTAALMVSAPSGGVCLYSTLAEFDQEQDAVQAMGMEEYRNRQRLEFREVQPPIVKDPPSRKYLVYRLLDNDGVVVYIGSTRDIEGRTRVHRKRWGPAFCSVSVEEYPDAASMLRAEREAIRQELPPLNVAGIS